MAKSIVGREREQQVLAEVLRSDRAELVGVYGRRRTWSEDLVERVLDARALLA